jgi:hypothetical protein
MKQPMTIFVAMVATVCGMFLSASAEGGSLTFASFAPDANLAAKSIMIDAPQEGNAVKFGTKLTTEQLRYFRWKDDESPKGSWRVSQDENGYLHPVMQGTVLYVR